MTTFTEDAIEAMARDLSMGSDRWRMYCRTAEIALAAFQRLAAERGYKLLSRDATEGMFGAAIDRSPSEAIRAGLYHSVWTAMFDAAPDLLESK